MTTAYLLVEVDAEAVGGVENEPICAESLTPDQAERIAAVVGRVLVDQSPDLGFPHHLHIRARVAGRARPVPCVNDSSHEVFELVKSSSPGVA